MIEKTKLSNDMKIIFLKILKQKTIDCIEAKQLIELFQTAELLPETLTLRFVSHARTE